MLILFYNPTCWAHMRSLFRQQIMSVKGRRDHLNSRGDSENLAPNITKFERQRHVLHDSFTASSLPLPVSLFFRASRIYGDGIAGWSRPSEERGMRCSGQRGNTGQYYPRWFSLWLIIRPWTLSRSSSLSSSTASLSSLFLLLVLSVSLYVYVYICMYARMYIRAYIYARTYIRVNTRVCEQICRYLCAHRQACIT